MTDLETKRRALREGALLLRADELGTLLVTGKDRQSWLNGLVTCDLAPLRPGDGAYGLAVAKNGKIMAELRFVLEKDRILVGLPLDRLALIQEHLDHHLIMEAVELEEVSGEHGWLLAHGPRAKELVEIARSCGASAAKVDTTGLGGAAIVAPPASLDGVVSACIEHLGSNGSMASGVDWDTLRVEIGVPRFGVDFDDQNYPQEAGLETLAVSFQKGCYLGQETVFMLQMRGHVKKKLVPLSIEGAKEPAIGSEITLPEGGSAVGNLTSRVPSPEGGGWLALGYVKYKQAVPGTVLSVSGRKAQVVGSPEARVEGS